MSAYEATQNKQELVEFYDDQIVSIKEPNGDIYVIVNNVLKNIGFVDQKIDHVRRTWAKDMVLSEGIKILPVLTRGGAQQTACISIEYLPFAIASISITPTMQREQPLIVEKIKRYKLECAKVLYKHFYNVPETSLDSSLTREEWAAFQICVQDDFNKTVADLKQYVNDQNEKIQLLLDREQAREAEIADLKHFVSSINVSVTSGISTIRKSIFASARKTEPQKPTVNNDWVEKANYGIRLINKYCPKKSPSNVLSEIIDLFAENNIDIKEFGISGKSVDDIIKSISINDYLRGMFEVHTNNLYRRYLNKETIDFSSPRKSLPSFDKVDEEINKVPCHGPYRYLKVYRVMNKISDDKLKKLHASEVKEHGKGVTYKKVIQTYPDMFNLMKQAVAQILEVENCG